MDFWKKIKPFLSEKLARALGCTSDSRNREDLLACLRRVDPETLLAAQEDPEVIPQDMGTISWGPTKDRYYMKTEPRM